MWITALLAAWFAASLLTAPWIGRFIAVHAVVPERTGVAVPEYLAAHARRKRKAAALRPPFESSRPTARA